MSIFEGITNSGIEYLSLNHFFGGCFMRDKRITIGNFNITFGDKEKPLLEYFDEIVYPALTSDIVRHYGENDAYFLDDINIYEFEENEYVLTGYFIRSTILEVKSRYSKDKGLTKTNQRYASDPYSMFIVFLKNHRVVLVENQKGSPDIRSFNTTIRYILKQYIQEANASRPKQEKLPYPRVDIVNIPSKVGVLEKLKDVKKIKKLILRLYPLNGDISVGQAYDSFRKQLEILGSRSGNVNFNTPEKQTKVAQLIAETNGTADPILEVEYRGGGHGTLKNESFSEKIELKLEDTAPDKENLAHVINFAKERNEIKNVSEDNKIIYFENIQSIRSKAKKLE